MRTGVLGGRSRPRAGQPLGQLKRMALDNSDSCGRNGTRQITDLPSDVGHPPHSGLAIPAFIPRAPLKEDFKSVNISANLIQDGGIDDIYGLIQFLCVSG